MDITLQLFGAFRTIGTEAHLNVPEDGTIQDLSQAVDRFLKDSGREDLLDTLAVSRFATEKTVLSPEAPLGDERRFAILPPVSGG